MDPERPEDPDGGPLPAPPRPAPERVRPAARLFTPWGIRVEVVAALLASVAALIGLELTESVDFADVTALTVGTAVVVGGGRAAISFATGHERIADGSREAEGVPPGTSIDERRESIWGALKTYGGTAALLTGGCWLLERVGDGSDALQLALAALLLGRALADIGLSAMVGIHERDRGARLLVEYPDIAFEHYEDDSDDDEFRLRFYTLS